MKARANSSLSARARSRLRPHSLASASRAGQRFLRTLEIRAARFQLVLGRVAIRAQPREFRFELGLARACREVLRGKSFEFALELGALDVRAFQCRAMLVDLRFERVGLALRMRQFPFERIEPRFARLDLRGRFEHHGANLFGRRAQRRELGGHHAQARARLLLDLRELFQPRIRGDYQFRQLVQTPARVAAVSFGQRDRLFGSRESAAPLDCDSLRIARLDPALLERIVGALALGANVGELADARAMLLFRARQLARLRFDRGEIYRRVTVFGAAAADHPARHHEVAVAGYENGAVTVEIRRRQRRMQIVGKHHVTEHRFGDRREARFDFEHLDQPSRDSGRVDRRMSR